MEEQSKQKSTIRRIGGYLHRVIPIMDSAGKAVNFSVTPIMVEFRARDLMQVIVGAAVLAVPVAFTEETWNLGKTLPLANVLILSALSFFFTSVFVYFNFYRGMLKGHVFEFVKRAVSIFIFSLLVVGMILTIIQKCPWQTNQILALKRVLIVAFPASMSAAVSDVLK